MSYKKWLQAMIAMTWIMASSVGCGARAPTPTSEVLAPTSTPEPSAMTPTPEPIPQHVMRYRDPYLGFEVEYPLGWEVSGYQERQDPMGPLTVVAFWSDLYPRGEQSYGRYSVDVAVGEATWSTVTDTVAYRLSVITPDLRDLIQRHCCLTVSGEPAMELTGYPWGRFGSRQIMIVHNERVYWMSFYPYNEQFNTPSDIAARAAFDTFLHSFTFIPITVLPTPAWTPVPTPPS